MVFLRFLVVAGMHFYPQSSQLLTKPSLEPKKKKKETSLQSIRHRTVYPLFSVTGWILFPKAKPKQIPAGRTERSRCDLRTAVRINGVYLCQCCNHQRAAKIGMKPHPVCFQLWQLNIGPQKPQIKKNQKTQKTLGSLPSLTCNQI